MEDGSEPVKAKRILFTISDCVTGKTNAVERYLNSSDENGIFLHGRDYESNTTLILAAAEETSTMVSLLLRHGAKINSVNRYGRSALMEAALWGRLDNVKLLLENGADRNLRDNGNRLANDLAQSTQKNRRERYVRAGGDILSDRKPVYQEDTFKRDNDRRGITRLLEGVDTKSKVVYGNLPTISQYEGYSFKRSPLKDSIVLRGPVENYPVTPPRKTVARLERGGKFPPIAAMSGWSHSSWPSLRVNGQQWTKEVFYISSLVGHTLPCDENDQGQRGKYYACHAEKQLIAYFIDRHVFLPRDTVPLPGLEAEIQSVQDQYEAFLLCSAGGKRLSSLRRQHQDLESELFDADDTYPGHERDELKIEALRSELNSAANQLEQLESSYEAQQTVSLENCLDSLNQKKVRHEALIGLTRSHRTR